MIRKRLTVCLAACCALLFLTGAGREEQLADREILVETFPIEGAAYPRVRVEAIIDAPPDKVWDVLIDCDGSHVVNSGVARSRLIRTFKGGLVCFEEIATPFPIKNLASLSRWQLTPGPPVWLRKWRLIDGDFAYATGSWTLTKYGKNQTRAVYENHFEPEIWVPGWLASGFITVGMPALMKDLRRAVEP